MELLGLGQGAILHGRYRVDRLLAEGGMSEIFLGNPLNGAGMVAIKRMRPSVGPEADEDLRQFRAEYDLLSALSHAALPHALDFFEEDGRHYLVEEFVPGETLERRMERVGRMVWTEAGPIVLSLLETLEYLHGKGIIYRDLKPSNVLITHGGQVRLIHMGAARRWKRGARRDTIPLGTPGFASPEHYGSAQTDPRSDVYSVGALAHFLLTGVPPGTGKPWRFEEPRELVVEIPVEISRAIMKALNLDPSGRFRTARQMWIQLSASATGKLVTMRVAPGLDTIWGQIGFLNRMPVFWGLGLKRVLPIVGFVGCIFFAAVMSLSQQYFIAAVYVGAACLSIRSRKPRGVGACPSDVVATIFEEGVRFSTIVGTAEFAW